MDPKTQRKERPITRAGWEGELFGSSFYMVFSSPWAWAEAGALFELKSSLRSSDLPPLYFHGLFPSCLLATTMLDSFSPGGSEVKAPACNVGDLGSSPGWGRFPGEGNGNQLQYSCLENPMDRGGWWATVHGVAKSQTRLSDFTFTFNINIHLLHNFWQNLVFCPLVS